MDACEATKVVMSRIKDLDPENASKIMGHILLQGQGDKEVIRLAFAPESLLLSCITQAKNFLGISPTSTTATNPSSPETSKMITSLSPRMLNLMHLNPKPSSFSKPISYSGVVTGSLEDEFMGGGVMDPIASPSGRKECLIFPYSDDLPSPQLHRRSNSVNDAPDFELGSRLCMYYARGGCKNGDSCRFSHNEIGVDVGSPGGDASGFDEFLRLKAFQQQQHRLSLMASGGLHHLPFNSPNLHDENQRSDLSSTGLPTGINSSSRQIYLTFPADSTFKEEDVATYFSMFGPVQDVRIPYQQRRMFGFVTFVYPETVKMILAKGNPHFIRDCRVLVKPYKDKGKIPERKQMYQQMERGDFPSTLSSSDVEPLDIPFGPRMLLNAQEKMLRRKFEEQEEVRNAIEFQSQRMMKMQLVDWQYPNHVSDPPSSLAAAVPFVSPRQAGLPMRWNSIASSDAISHSTFHDAKVVTIGDESIFSKAAEFSSYSEQHVSDADQAPD